MMKSKTLSVLALCAGLAACSESIPNPSGTYRLERDGILRAHSEEITWKISPLTDGKDGKFKVEATYEDGNSATGVFFLVKNSKNKFCHEGWGDLNQGCFEYVSGQGIRLENQTEFSKKID